MIHGSVKVLSVAIVLASATASSTLAAGSAATLTCPPSE